jgi:hypothetical protein
VEARLQVNNHKITSTLQWTLTGNPDTFLSRMCSLMSNLQ